MPFFINKSFPTTLRTFLKSTSPHCPKPHVALRSLLSTDGTPWPGIQPPCRLHLPLHMSVHSVTQENAAASTFQEALVGSGGEKPLSGC